jgi:hypothetical protein
VVLTPVMMVFAAILLLVWSALLLFPLFTVAYLCQEEWWTAAIYAVLWPAAWLLTRWEWFCVNSHDILNERENI